MCRSQRGQYRRGTLQIVAVEALGEGLVDGTEFSFRLLGAISGGEPARKTDRRSRGQRLLLLPEYIVRALETITAEGNMTF
ncbi:MAG TPA: hypothetical protein VNN25_22015 [Thermoanaerobaculia bacterium]|nr:hypothetical protein [Thermoanaerobaculia bacterium]